MTKRDLIDTIAQEGLVERLVANVCHRRHRALPDLVQMVYEALLKSDGQKVLNLYQRNALNFFIVRIIENLYFSLTSPYYRQIRKFSRMSDELKDEWMNDDRLTQFHLIEEEYTASRGVFDEDDVRVRCCKDALRGLSETDRCLFIHYADLGSVRKMSQILGVSKSTVQNRVAEIRRKIIESMPQARRNQEKE